MNKLLQKYFGFDPATTTIRTEIIAGVSTFLTMAYILAVNPAILGITGMDKGALFATTAITSRYCDAHHGALCQDAFRTCAGHGHQCLLCLYRLPIYGAHLAVRIDCRATGRFDIYSPYCDQRPRKDRLFLPPSIQKAIGVGIGLFIAFIGLQNAGISVKNDANPCLLWAKFSSRAC